MSKKYVAPTRAQPIGSKASRETGWTSRDSRADRFVLGSEAMAKLNAVEGIRQSQDSRIMFAEFERGGASNEQRRRAIFAMHARKG